MGFGKTADTLNSSLRDSSKLSRYLNSKLKGVIIQETKFYKIVYWSLFSGVRLEGSRHVQKHLTFEWPSPSK